MKINRNLTASIAVSILVILGFIGWLISGASNETANRTPTTYTSAESSTQPAVEPKPEASEIIEDPNPKNLPAGNIWTYDCENEVQLPESIYLTCADGGWYIYKIKWYSWDEKEAKATGYFSQKVCEPNCAEGFRVDTPVTLTISIFERSGKKIYLTNLDMRASTDQNFESGDRTLTWDLGEFAMMMESN